MNIQESQITGLRPVLWHNYVAALLALLVEQIDQDRTSNFHYNDIIYIFLVH